MFHTKAVYVALGIAVVLYIMMLFNFGIQSNGLFASFDASKDSFAQYLYFFPKSAVLQIIILVFLSIFLAAEYAYGFQKNTFAIQNQKWRIVIERFILYFITAALFVIVVGIISAIAQVFNPNQTAYGSLDIGQYVVYLIVQLLFLAAVASLIGMSIHLFHSKVIGVLIGLGYGGIMIYMVLIGISMTLFHSDILTKYLLYQNSGKLPYVFHWDTYAIPLAVLCFWVLVYNGISYYILIKKDMG